MATSLLLKNSGESLIDDVLEVIPKKDRIIFYSYSHKDDLIARVIELKLEEVIELVAYLNYQIEKNYGK